VGRMGGFEVEDHQVRALASWIDRQPAATLAHVGGAAALRGRALFESAQTSCSSCHAGAALTSNTTVDVGTGGLFQVPSLRGLALRAPYMHDGCAATLRDRFDTSCGGERHGNIAGLSEGEIDDLVAYLETL
jgi:cytochrome c peroxidase